MSSGNSCYRFVFFPISHSTLYRVFRVDVDNTQLYCQKNGMRQIWSHPFHTFNATHGAEVPSPTPEKNPKNPQIPTPVPASTISTSTFSAVGFSKDTTAEEYSPMQALMVVVSILPGGIPDPVRWNTRSPNWEWNVPLFINWRVRAVHLKYFAYFFLLLLCVLCYKWTLKFAFFFTPSSCCFSKRCYLEINTFILGDVHVSFLCLISVLLQAHSI